MERCLVKSIYSIHLGRWIEVSWPVCIMAVRVRSGIGEESFELLEQSILIVGGFRGPDDKATKWRPWEA